MKMTFFTNACCQYESFGKKLLTDPWLKGGAFLGSWFHYPELKTRPEDVKDYDYLYISHLHPDHYCHKTLEHFDKRKPLIIYDDEGPNFLEKMALKDGFTNIIKLKNEETITLEPFKLTMFGPFVKHPFYECKVGNIIDSCLVIDDSEHVIINANDNTPSLEAAHMLKSRFPDIHVAQLNYNAAGPYPSCFMSLRPEERLKRSDEIRKRQLKHMCDVSDILKPTYLQPFAGAYVIGGTKYEKNRTLGTSTLEEAADFIETYFEKNEAHHSFALPMNEGASIDDHYIRQTCGHKNSLIRTLKDEIYSYNLRRPKIKDIELFELVQTARKRMFKMQLNLGYKEDFDFYIRVGFMPLLFKMNLDHDLVEMTEMLRSKNPYILCHLDPVLFEDVLTRKAHWNNAEIGCHIDFYREPDIYRPDFHTFMSFFHA